MLEMSEEIRQIENLIRYSLGGKASKIINACIEKNLYGDKPVELSRDDFNTIRQFMYIIQKSKLEDYSAFNDGLMNQYLMERKIKTEILAKLR